MSEVKIGYIPTRRDVFDRSEAYRYRGVVKKAVQSLGAKLVDIDGINGENLLFDERDLPAVIDRMQREKVDGLFFPHCNFGTEDLVAKVAKELGKPVLIWVRVTMLLWPTDCVRVIHSVACLPPERCCADLMCRLRTLKTAG